MISIARLACTAGAVITVAAMTLSSSLASPAAQMGPAVASTQGFQHG